MPEPGEEAARAVADIERAEFIALRLDTSDDARFSPVGKPSHMEELEDFFARHSRLLAAGRLPLRLGVCCAVWCEEQCLWELRSHELGLWPGAHLEMSSKVLRARHQQAAVLKAPLGQETTTSRWAAQLAYSARWVFAVLREKRAPIIVHDGLSDLLQLLDKFAVGAPAGHLEFGKAWMEHFPLVFDTRLMAEEDPPRQATQANQQIETIGQFNEAVMRWRSMSEGGCGNLADLHGQLLRVPRSRSHLASSRFRECGMSVSYKASSGRNGLARGSGEGYMARSAMEVAETFLLLMGHLLYPPPPDDMTEEIRKKRKTASDSQTITSSSTQLEQGRSRSLALNLSLGSGSCEAGPTSAPAQDSQVADGDSSIATAGSEEPPSSTPPISPLPTEAVAMREATTPPKGDRRLSQTSEAAPGASPEAKSLNQSVANAEERCDEKKRARISSSEKASECSAAIASLASRLASTTRSA